MWTQRIPLAPVIHAEVCQEVRKSVIRHACAIHRLCITGPQLLNNRTLVESSVADPGSGAFLTPGSGVGLFRIPDLGSRISADLGSRISDSGSQTHIFES